MAHKKGQGTSRNEETAIVSASVLKNSVGKQSLLVILF